MSSPTLSQRNPLLMLATYSLTGLSVLLFVGILLDSEQILGLNRWVKPLKFCLSIIIYFLTLSWLSAYLPTRWMRIISWQIVACLIIEMAIIVGQAMRGQPSHFNRNDALGIVLYGIMGFFILYNTLLVALITRRFFTDQILLPITTLRGIQLGLLLFLVGSALGGYMSSSMGHTVGAPDGGVGLPFLNWSTQFGDLRVAHFIGLHGLQVLILLGVLLKPKAQSLVWLYLAFGIMLLYSFFAFAQALAGQPFIELR